MEFKKEQVQLKQLWIIELRVITGYQIWIIFFKVWKIIIGLKLRMMLQNKSLKFLRLKIDRWLHHKHLYLLRTNQEPEFISQNIIDLISLNIVATLIAFRIYKLISHQAKVNQNYLHNLVTYIQRAKYSNLEKRLITNGDKWDFKH